MYFPWFSKNDKTGCVPWAPALDGQGGRVPTLEIIWVGIAHPEFPSLEIV